MSFYPEVDLRLLESRRAQDLKTLKLEELVERILNLIEHQSGKPTLQILYTSIPPTRSL